MSKKRAHGARSKAKERKRVGSKRRRSSAKPQPRSARAVRAAAAPPPAETARPVAGPKTRVSRGPLPFLGHPRAVRIVCGCAGTIPANLGRTLSELGVAGGPFQICVFDGVTKEKCRIDPDAIPNSSDTMLLTVVSVIQNAPAI